MTRNEARVLDANYQLNRSARVRRRFPHLYSALVAYGHTAFKAAEIVLDAKRGDLHARAWIGIVFALRHHQ